MKRREWLANWGLSGLKIKAGFLEADFAPGDADREAAWELYVELLTRITTQALPADQGDERTALESVHSIFPHTREILKRHKAACEEFAKLSIPVLNQVIRPFTAKWHRRLVNGELESDAHRAEFRGDLNDLQNKLLSFAKALADLAGVEDLTELELE